MRRGYMLHWWNQKLSLWIFAAISKAQHIVTHMTPIFAIPWKFCCFWSRLISGNFCIFRVNFLLKFYSWCHLQVLISLASVMILERSLLRPRRHRIREIWLFASFRTKFHEGCACRRGVFCLSDSHAAKWQMSTHTFTECTFVLCRSLPKLLNGYAWLPLWSWVFAPALVRSAQWEVLKPYLP